MNVIGRHRRTRTNVALLVVAALLGIAIHAELARERAIARDPLTRLDPATVASVAVTCSGCATRRFERVGGHWRMREPKNAPADDDSVDKLAAIAALPVRFRHARAEIDVAKVGLAHPVATLALDRTLLKFGTTDAIYGDRYVEVDGVVALVPDRFSVRLFATPESELARSGSPAPPLRGNGDNVR